MLLTYYNNSVPKQVARFLSPKRKDIRIGNGNGWAANKLLYGLLILEK